MGIEALLAGGGRGVPTIDEVPVDGVVRRADGIVRRAVAGDDDPLRPQGHNCDGRGGHSEDDDMRRW